MRARDILSIFAGALGLVFTAGLHGAAAPDLSADSPFLPPSNGQAATVTEGAAIELRGIMTMPDGMRFSIYDTGKKSSTWVRLNERGTPFVVRSYNVVDGSDQVKIDYQGNSLTLGLKAPKIAAMAAQNVPQGPAPGGPGGGFNRGNAVTQSVMLNPTPADEAARLQAVVDAVAARRAARNQAQQQVITQTAQPIVPADANQQALRQQQRLQRQQSRPPQQK